MKLKKPARPKKQSAARESRPSTPPLKPIVPAVTSPEDEVSQRAYFMYLNQGCHDGFDVYHWLMAEAEIEVNTEAGRLQGAH
ncbi:MAG: DUF2934 domain-containing protein [Puniceicoccaceae bacterium]|nr:MAG: DUF2934 domain-containing protein [Puniceicoccaceae bacterium]